MSGKEVTCKRCGNLAKWFDSFMRETTDTTSENWTKQTYWVDVYKCEKCGQKQQFRRENNTNQIS